MFSEHLPDVKNNWSLEMIPSSSMDIKVPMKAGSLSEARDLLA
jgi:hypothetical protein